MKAIQTWLASALISVGTGAGTAHAWEEDEHARIGAEGYLAACACLDVHIKRRAEGEVAYATGSYACSSDALPQPADPAGAKKRLEILCPVSGWRRAQRAAAFGQLVAISGDHVDSPEVFEDELQGKLISSVTNYGHLAIKNYAHFQPSARLEWRAQRNKALELAVSAAASVGSQQVAQIEKAVAIQAFADHFLEDSFAAGHIGINRPASSPSGALALHDWWNDAGRNVANGSTGADSMWKTFGDGHLDSDCKANACRSHLHEGQTRSIRDLIWAFANGARTDSAEQQTELTLPSYAFAPRVVRTFYGTFLRYQEEYTSEPGEPVLGDARTHRAWTRTTHAARPAYRTGQLFLGYAYDPIAYGSQAVLAEVAHGLLPIAVWWRVGIGASLDFSAAESGGGWVGATIRFKPMMVHVTALSFAEGIFNHELLVGELDFIFRPDRKINTFDFVGKPVAYRLNIDLGAVAFHGDIGLALGKVGASAHARDDFRVGYFATGGVSWVFSGSGGGNWHGQGK